MGLSLQQSILGFRLPIGGRLSGNSVRLIPTARAATSNCMRHTSPVSCIDHVIANNRRGVGKILQMYFLLLLNARHPICILA